MSGITHEWNGTVLTITSDSGTSSADLKGAKGDTGIRGAQGVAGLTPEVDYEQLGETLRSNAAPAGYGLGAQAVQVNTSIIDTITKSGWYKLQNNNSYKVCGINVAYGVLRVDAWSDGYFAQTIYQTTSNDCYRRTGYNGSFTEWVKVGVATNPNLLDNWYMARPVNQRCGTTYTAEAFTIDRWMFEQWQSVSPLLEVKDGCIAISSAAAAGTANTTKIRQVIYDAAKLAGKTVTFSVKFKDISDVTSTYPRLVIYSRGASAARAYTNITESAKNKILSVTTTLASDINYLYVAIGNDANSSGDGGFYIEVESAKLELGGVSTLAFDSPPKFSEQLLECQRYYIRYYADSQCQFAVGATTGTTIYATVYLPTQLIQANITVGYNNVNIYPFISGGSVEVTGVGGYTNSSRNSVILTATHASTNNLPAKTPATIRLGAGGYIEISAEV